ncbi:sensor domain-containing diguanylate cyclase [Lysobacter fragariae]
MLHHPTINLSTMSIQRNRLRKLIAELRILRTAMNELSAFVYAKDLAGRYTFANRAVHRLYGAGKGEVVGADDTHFWDVERSEAIWRNDRTVIDAGVRLETEEHLAMPDAPTRSYFSVKAPVRDAGGRITGVAGVSTDITHLKRLEADLREKNALLESLLENVDACIYVKDRARRYSYANAKMAALVDRSPEELIGRTDEELVAPELAAGWRVLDDKVFATGETQSGNEVSITPEGETRHFWVVQIPQRDASGDVASLLGISTDFTQFYRLQEELRRQAMTDELTGVRNRRSLLLTAQREFARASRYELPLSVLMIDIDHFKDVNDTHGHDVGDKVLKSITDALLRELRDSDVLGRFGGEEFAILLPNTTRAGAAILAERLRERVGAIRLTGDWDGVVEPTISIGVACSQGASCIEAVIKRADQSLYEAKANGRNQVHAAADTPEPDDPGAALLVPT